MYGKENTPKDELLKRPNNFKMNNFPFADNLANNELLLNEILDNKSAIESSIKDQDYKIALLETLHEIYSLYEHFVLFEDAPDSFHQCAEKVYSFTALCFFLNKSKKIDGQSQSHYVYENSWLGFNDPDSPDYFDLYAGACPSDTFKSKIDSFRQERYRTLSRRPVYDNKGLQWNSLSPDQNFENSLFFMLESDDDSKLASFASQYGFSLEQLTIIKETFKQMKNLKTNIESKFNANQDSQYHERLQKAINSLYPKLKKLKYENYLLLQKLCLLHIKQCPTYYGINLFRLEYEWNPYFLSKTITSLANCQSDSEKLNLLTDYACMHDIPFPKARAELLASNIPPSAFLFIQEDYMQLSLLILDEFIEKGYFGANWEKLFQKITSEMANDVLFNPDDIDYTIYPESQKGFIKLIAAKVLHLDFRFFLHIKNFKLPPEFSLDIW